MKNKKIAPVLAVVLLICSDRTVYGVQQHLKKIYADQRGRRSE